MLDKIYSWNAKAAEVFVWIGGASLLFAAFMVTVDVILRDLLSVTLGGADEISGYIFAVSTAFAFPYALLHRVNVRIDGLYMAFPSGVKAVLDLLALVALAAFIFPLTWWAYWMLVDSYSFWTRSITPLRTPVAIPQTLWFAGLALFCLTIVLVFLMGLLRLAKGDLAGVQAIAGAQTVDEEVEASGSHDAGEGR